MAKAFGCVGLTVGALSVYWAVAGRPEIGGSLADRLEQWQHLMATDRVAIAFVADVAFFYAWQVVLLGSLKTDREREWMRWTPFFGLAAWLIV